MKLQYNKICPFLGVDISHFSPYLPFQKLLSNWSRLVSWKGPGTQAQFSKSFKRFQKYIPLAYIYELIKFGGLMSCGSKDMFKNALCLMY